jgi:ATP-dependent RNA helicase RhlE
MFSATFPDDIRKFADQLLKNPVRIQVAARNAVADLVTHSAFRVDPLRKRELLTELVRSRDMRQVLVFTSTKLSANRLSRQLERDGFNCAALHSDKSQLERTQTLAAFKEGKIRVLVATDVASRGLDIESLPHVVNYELPPNPEDYIHRIGRTGRAGATGEAISLVSPDENDLLASIEKMLKKSIPIQSWHAEPHRREGREHHREHRTSRQPDVPPSRTVSGQPSAPQPVAALFSESSARTAPGAAKRPKQVAALFLPPVPAKQE